MSLAFRAYREEDREPLIALWNACDLLRPYHDVARELDLICSAGDAELFLGFDDGQLAGSVLVGHDGHRAWMYRVAVAPALRGRGHGKALVARAEAWAMLRGLPRLMLLVREDNAPVSAFYEQQGYERLPRLVLSKSFATPGKPALGEPATDDRIDPRIDVVVTSLEMTAVPTRPSPPAPVGMHLALLRVAAPSLAYCRFLQCEVGNFWFWQSRAGLDDASLRAVIHDPRVELYVLHADGAPAGHAEIDRRSQPEVALTSFGLMPNFRGRGLGWYLLNWAIDAAWTGDTRRLTVDTCTLDGPRPLQAYQRAGFRPYRQTRKSIPDPDLTGRKPLPHKPGRP